MSTAAHRHHMTDLGRRIEARRARLGLSQEEVATRAGATPGYVADLEERVCTPRVEFLVRIANALETTVQDLTGYTADLPVGGSAAGGHARMVEIDETGCWELLDDHGIGRVAVTGRNGTEIFPVNYRVVEGEIAFLTATDSPLAQAAGSGAEIAFEEDRLDEAFSQGWSVLLVGAVRTGRDRAATEKLRDAAHSAPWAGGGQDQLVMLAPHRVTGRRVLVEGAPGTPTRRES
ncbi:pyridoxamine 5'-phosphate oxidase family protein [Streptomyces sp. NBC_01525]|uniref:helix-turn-helix domain-containing protein n=1 Tax=Streptomyces sp. NBC_01525 TaxID=2903893 RepID=UPI00386A4CAD